MLSCHTRVRQRKTSLKEEIMAKFKINVPYIARKLVSEIEQTLDRHFGVPMNLTIPNMGEDNIGKGGKALVHFEGANFKLYEETWSIEPAERGSTFSFEQLIKLPYGIVGELTGIYRARRAAKVVEEMLKRLKIAVERSMANVK